MLQIRQKKVYSLSIKMIEALAGLFLPHEAEINVANS